MPFKSEKQRRYLWTHHPGIAKKWAHKYGSRPKYTKEAVAMAKEMNHA